MVLNNNGIYKNLFSTHRIVDTQHEEHLLLLQTKGQNIGEKCENEIRRESERERETETVRKEKPILINYA